MPERDFSPHDEHLAAALKALAHPARIAILRVLSERQACICGELVLELPLAQATVSQHLKVLKEAGWIRGEVDGPRVCYCIDADFVARLRPELDTFLGSLTPLAPTCC
jgi:DNA-binding transcriptional ArsR family regulator